MDSDEIAYFYRPQLLHWLVNYSDAAQRKILKRMLLNIVEHDEASKVSWFGSKVAPVEAEHCLVEPLEVHGIVPIRNEA
jgi:hypothetical protein